MNKKSKSEHDFTLQILGVILFLVGLAICFTGIGILIGVPLMIVAARLGYKKKKGWLCPNCGYFYDAK